jgi:hypothetical protein
VLALQGENDEYGSLAQIEAIAHLHADTSSVSCPAVAMRPSASKPRR